jgi:L-threonylcarbamoyladenylate synthase
VKVLKLRKETFTEVLKEARDVLKKGGIIIAPTDTVYGILGNAEDEDTIRKAFELKQRPHEKALPIFVSGLPMARKFSYIPDARIQFLERVWPGAVTGIFRHKGMLPSLLTGGSETLGIRIPNHPFILSLLQEITFPLLQTSANISAKLPAKDLDEIKGYFSHSIPQPDLVIDGGTLEGKSSTVIDFSGTKPVILRIGSVTREDLEIEI